MHHRVLAGIATTSVAALFAAAPSAASPPPPPPHPPTVLHQGVVTQQDVASQPGSEPDTVVEPDVAVNPTDAANAVAAAHDSRFRDGGAVAISVAWTRDSGAHWAHAPVRGVTTATGGAYERASDPVVAFGPDGTAYLSILAINVSGCDSAVLVLRSADGGATWSRPVAAHKSASCGYSDDKNWLVVDNGATSPHRGRVYQFWTPFISSDPQGTAFLGAPQALRWSDDRGATWSRTSYLVPKQQVTQNSQPMILPDGSIVDTFYDFGIGAPAPDLVPGARPDNPSALDSLAARRSAVAAAPINASGTIVATTSTDGGATWSPETVVTVNGGGYSPGVRCCLFGADIDRVNGVMHVAWLGGVGSTDPVYTASSRDGEQWTSPVRVSRHDVPGITHVNADVSAYAGKVYVTYGTRRHPERSGGTVRQDLSVSTDGGHSFAAPTHIGPVSVLRYAARAGGYFPGDYIGTAVSRTRLYVVWAVSSKPPTRSTSPFHQVIYGVAMRR